MNNKHVQMQYAVQRPLLFKTLHKFFGCHGLGPLAYSDSY